MTHGLTYAEQEQRRVAELAPARAKPEPAKTANAKSPAEAGPLPGVWDRLSGQAHDAARDVISSTTGESLEATLLNPKTTAASARLAITNAPSRQLVAAIRNQTTFQRIVALDIDLLALPRLVDYGWAFAGAIGHPPFLQWVVQRRAVLRFLNLIGRAESSMAIGALVHSSYWELFSREIAFAGEVDPPFRKPLRRLFDQASGRVTKARLIELRFLKKFTRNDGDLEGEFEEEVLPSLWDALERLPDRHTLKNRSLKTILRLPNVSPHEPEGGYDDRIHQRAVLIGYDLSDMDGPSEFARSNDVLGRVDLMQRAVTHEVGHSVAKELQLDIEGRGSPFSTDEAFGRWQRESEFRVPEAARRPGPDQWRGEPTIVDGRAYTYRDGADEYWSYAASLRNGKHLSDYQFASPTEFFAEIYAAFYVASPQEPGKAVKEWRPQIYEWFLEHVHKPVAHAAAKQKRP